MSHTVDVVTEIAPTRAAEVFLELMRRHSIKKRSAFARDAGVDPSQVSKWWNGGVEISDRVLADIIRRFGEDPLEFGIDTRTLQEKLAAEGAARMNSDEAPQWFVDAMDALNTKIDKLIKAEERRR